RRAATVIDDTASAPRMVNISRNMPTFRFVMWSRTYAEAEPLEVAMTDTMLTAIARLISIPKNVGAGMSTTPPPIPLIALTRPATTATIRMSSNDMGGASGPAHVAMATRWA